MQLNEITPGTPATIAYYSDTRAAVVVKRTAKRVTVARVEVDESTRRNENENLAPGEFPVRLADGDVKRPIVGTEQVFTLYVSKDGTAYATRGDKSIRVRFGHAIERIDYKI